MRNLWVSLVVVGLLSACASTETKEQPGAAVEERKPSVGEPGAKPGVEPTAKPLVGKPVAVNPLKDPKNILSQRSVYFDYDSSLVKDQYKPLVTAHAKYLAQNRAARMTIQGNTDERGSREYNLALGQRRSDAVKRMMTLLGAGESQIETISFGEEKPRCGGNEESCWSQNRRADVVYQGE
ncbi:MAG: peptidoglycan-associated lipoprotein Pal [Betaproteobacteria bacterium]|nr:peptidoglycan-associated lipoprotein Pal [Betaproteobacteria bacterium]